MMKQIFLIIRCYHFHKIPRIRYSIILSKIIVTAFAESIIEPLISPRFDTENNGGLPKRDI